MKTFVIQLFLVLLVASCTIAAPKRIFFIRHAESATNKFWDAGQFDMAKNTLDPNLSERGVNQAHRVRKIFEDQKIDLVALSPMTRTLQTGTLIFEDHPAPMLAMPDVVESCYGEMLGALGCNGRERQVLQEEFPQVSFENLGPAWTGIYTGSGESEPSKRMTRFKEWLQAQDVNTIAVVSHGTFLKQLLGVKSPKNCEVIEAYFDDEGGLAIKANKNEPSFQEL